MPDRKLTTAQKRLLRFLIGIEDEEIKDLIVDVIGIEISNRSSQHFPMQTIREKIDAVARLRESKTTRE